MKDKYPFRCESNPEVEYIRNTGKVKEALALVGYLWPSLCILYVSIVMFLLYRAVRDIEVNAEKYSFVAKFKGHNKKKTRKRSRRVMIQGILYSLAMVLTWGFTFTNIILFLVSNKTYQVIQSIVFVFIHFRAPSIS